MLAMDERRHRHGGRAAGATQAIGAVDGPDVTQAVAATTPGTREDEEEEDSSNRTRTYAIILAILLLLLLVAGFFLARNLGYLGGAASFNLPNVTGQPVAQATTTLKNDGLVVKVSDQVSTDTPGTVISTDPAAKSLVKKGDTVTLNVAMPAPISKVTVPSGLIGCVADHRRGDRCRGRACSTRSSPGAAPAYRAGTVISAIRPRARGSTRAAR